MCSRLPFWNCSFKQRLILEMTYVTAASNVLVVQTSFVAEKEIIIFFLNHFREKSTKSLWSHQQHPPGSWSQPGAKTLLNFQAYLLKCFTQIYVWLRCVLLFSQTFPQEKDMLLDAAMTGVQWSSSKSQLILINSSTSCFADPIQISGIPYSCSYSKYFGLTHNLDVNYNYPQANALSNHRHTAWVPKAQRTISSS